MPLINGPIDLSNPFGTETSRSTVGFIGFKTACYWLLIIFVVVFPKSGIKIGGVPVTTGYVLICIMAVPALMGLCLARTVGSACLVALALCVPFAGLVGLSLAINGAEDQGAAVASIMTFILLPGIFLGLFSNQLAMLSPYTLKQSIVFAMRAVAIFGIILFLVKMETGSFFEVPYLTVNADDVGLLETKNIQRGNIYKLISTYNNGNVFGASLLLLLPIYLRFERNRLLAVIVIAAMMLTLSRSVWLGLVVALGGLVFLRRGLTIGSLLTLASCGMAFALAVWFLVAFIGQDVTFLTDSSLGGRVFTLESLSPVTLGPSQRVDMIPEIVYAGVIQQYGILGLCEFVIFITAPIVAAKLVYGELSGVQRYAALGIYSYIGVCFADGAILLIPVLAIFFFVATILLEAPRIFGTE